MTKENWINKETIEFYFNAFNKYSALFPNDEINKRIELFNKTKLYSYSFNCDIDNKLS